MLNFFFLQWSKKYKINTPLDAVFTHRIWLIILHLNPGIDFLLLLIMASAWNSIWVLLVICCLGGAAIRDWEWIFRHSNFRTAFCMNIYMTASTVKEIFTEVIVYIYIPPGTFPRFIRNTVIIKPGITVNIKKVEISKTEI